MVQHIHSFRASGVIPFHAASALAEAVRAFRESAGSLWATPPEIVSVMYLYYYNQSHSLKVALPHFMQRKYA